MNEQFKNPDKTLLLDIDFDDLKGTLSVVQSGEQISYSTFIDGKEESLNQEELKELLLILDEESLSQFESQMESFVKPTRTETDISEVDQRIDKQSGLVEKENNPKVTKLNCLIDKANSSQILKIIREQLGTKDDKVNYKQVVLMGLAGVATTLLIKTSIDKLTTKKPKPVPTPTQFTTPVKGRISSFFGKRKAPIQGATTDHGAIDIAAGVGTPILSPMDGKIKIVKNAKCGNGLILKANSNNLRFGVCHLNEYKISDNTIVKRNQIIGTVGNTGNSAGPHLHFKESVLRNGTWTAVDPLENSMKKNTATINSVLNLK